MNAADHYTAAEQLAISARHHIEHDREECPLGLGLALAQLAAAHATMAAAAASIDAAEYARQLRVLYRG